MTVVKFDCSVYTKCIFIWHACHGLCIINNELAATLLPPHNWLHFWTTDFPKMKQKKIPQKYRWQPQTPFVCSQCNHIYNFRKAMLRSYGIANCLLFQLNNNSNFPSFLFFYRVLRTPGGGSSDIFGSDMPQTPRTMKNRMASNIFSAEKDVALKNNGKAKVFQIIVLNVMFTVSVVIPFTKSPSWY